MVVINSTDIASLLIACTVFQCIFAYFSYYHYWWLPSYLKIVFITIVKLNYRTGSLRLLLLCASCSQYFLCICSMQSVVIFSSFYVSVDLYIFVCHFCCVCYFVFSSSRVYELCSVTTLFIRMFWPWLFDAVQNFASVGICN